LIGESEQQMNSALGKNCSRAGVIDCSSILESALKAGLLIVEFSELVILLPLAASCYCSLHARQADQIGSIANKHQLQYSILRFADFGRGKN
jgi:hypothetical protein